ncbi:AAA family ATPase [Sphingobium lignivorans]|uniref:AAA+ ATPase domain-containing protein n=1 Tax=Sphingobium lignivorans TaxID=2735886 RepID=A0ABR6NJF1_9SPHN|nr:AAA family ATPase [Sphingobium lignivorans]MBB5987407.1 hypothetical protein [Sphingobium lignivorans]
MIHIDTLPIDVEEVRDWANAYRDSFSPPLSWPKFGQSVGLPHGTLQPFCKGKYAGDNERIARQLYKFKQGLESRDAVRQSIPVDPGYFETPTSLLIRELLAVAHSGTITVGAFAPGLGKTYTAEDFTGRVQPVSMITLDGITGTRNGIIRATADALNVAQSRWVSELNTLVVRHLRKAKGLLLIDEANHATPEALEQLRSWHDATGVGICLLGNEELLGKITSGVSFARLKRRIRRSVVQQVPLEGDIIAFCDAWQISDIGIRALLKKQAMQGASGGLGELTQIVSDAAVLADEDGGRLELAHVQWAIQRRKIEIVRP